MKKKYLSLSLLLSMGLAIGHDAAAQTGSNPLVAQPIPDRTVPYRLSDEGVAKPIRWGLDLAWLSEENVRRGMRFMGPERVDVIRSSFMPTDSLIDGQLKPYELGKVQERLAIISLLPPETEVQLNCDHPSVHAWYTSYKYGKERVDHWVQLINATKKLHEEAGRKVVTVAPFNEPDYTSTGQGNPTMFRDICQALSEHPDFQDVRISGGNTLNPYYAFNGENILKPHKWYTIAKDYLDEGNTHQLAGSFDDYAGFFETVCADGKYASNDELHNTMEAMVGVEYGMQTGIWWGTAEYTRGEFVKASDGVRLAYAEHRPNWTAASVYRSPEGKIQAFGGTSERQANPTAYRFLSKERDVFYNGHGPQREYVMQLPGGPKDSYQNGQTNAEGVVNITWGEDIQPVIDGTYVLVNRNSKMLMEVADGSTGTGAGIQQNTFSNKEWQQWNVNPIDPARENQGDFSYFTITSVHTGFSPDIENWSLEENGGVIMYTPAFGNNQQWFLEYADDGWFYIRSRHSGLCLEVINSSKNKEARIVQGAKDEEANQQWRFLPIKTRLNWIAPAAPTDLKATAQGSSIRLDWTACAETDFDSYAVYRAEEQGGEYSLIARDLTDPSFVDHKTLSGQTYFYKVKNMDKSRNQSEDSAEVSAAATGAQEMVVHYLFDANTEDQTPNLNHAAPYSESIAYAEGRKETQAISLNGTDAFLQLPTGLTNHEEITVSTWIKWEGGSTEQRIFSFGDGEDNHISLIPKANNGQMRLVIAQNGQETAIETEALPTSEWTYVTVTLGKHGAALYQNGEKVGETTDGMAINPLEMNMFVHYIGRGQGNNALLKAGIDDFLIYNYALNDEEIRNNFNGIYTGIETTDNDLNNGLSLYPTPANEVLHIDYAAENENALSTISLYNATSTLVKQIEMKGSYQTEVPVSDLPSGIYLLRLTGEEKTVTRKIIVQH